MPFEAKYERQTLLSGSLFHEGIKFEHLIGIFCQCTKIHIPVKILNAADFFQPVYFCRV